MKRTAGTFLLLACLGGCMHADRAKVPAQMTQAVPSKAATKFQGPNGEPIATGNTPGGGMSPGLMNAGYVTGDSPRPGADLTQAGFRTSKGVVNNCDNCGPTGHSGQGGHGGHGNGNAGGGHGSQPVLPMYQKYGGIVPVPSMGPPGAVAAIGALPAAGPMMPMNMRTSVRFTAPEEMLGYKVTWFGPNGWNDAPLIAPAKYNFLQGGVYRLKISAVPNHLDKVYYPTLEVLPGTPKTLTYLAHSTAPLTFTNEDFEQVNSGNFLVKVVYLPDPNNQDLATVVGPNELVSTRLEPGLDPIVEAQKRGTILLIVRMGNIDLQAPNTPAMDAPNPYLMQRMAPPPVKLDIPVPMPKMPKGDGKNPAKLPTLP